MKKMILIFFSVICFFSAVIFVVFNFFMFPLKFKTDVFKWSKEYDVDSDLVFAIIKAESGFNKNAESNVGALGLMQIMPETGEWIADALNIDDFETSDLFDEKTNIRFGCFYLRYLFDKFDNEKFVVCAYNAGETVVRKWLGDDDILLESEILFAETRQYLDKVLKFRDVYKNRLNLFA